MDPSGIYKKKPLLTPTSIRILAIERGKESDVLQCKFKVVDLNDDPVFEALSYVWGKDGKIVPIQCDGGLISVTPSLAYAMRRIRQKPTQGRSLVRKKTKSILRSLLKSSGRGVYFGSARRSNPADSECHQFCEYLWADALCINQDDDDERSQQVGLMRKIYEQAKTVLVMLGSCENDIRLISAFHLIQLALEHREAEIKRRPPGMKHEDAPMISFEGVTKQKNEERGFPPFNSPKWQDLCWFFNLPWFSRLWVYQEISLSRSAVAFIGDYEILDPILIGDAASWFSKKQYTVEPGKLNFNNGVVFMLNRFARMDLEEGRRPRLRQLLARTRDYGVTYPEDRVYGLLGIASESNHPVVHWDILPDKSKSYQEVYRDVARLIIGCSADLDILNEVTMPLQRSRSEWSSWVPNWNDYPLGYMSLSIISNMRFNACASRPREIEYSEDPQVIRLQGFDVDLVTYCTEPISANIWDNIPELWRLITRSLGHHSRKYVNSSDTLGTAFTMTVTAATNGDCDPAEDDLAFLASASAFWKKRLGVDLLAHGSEQSPGLPPLSSRMAQSTEREGFEPGNSSFSPFEIAIALACQNRCFFKTQNNYIGIGPAEMKLLDNVVILYGGRTPYILRPCNHSWIGGGSLPMARGEDDGSRFLVGDCYVHGVMNGEMMERSDNEEKFYDIR